MANWKDLVRGIAPSIAGALGGPAAAGAIKSLSTILLGKPDGTEAEIEAHLQAPLSAAEELALRQADQAFALAMYQAANAGDAIDAQDRSSARDMQKAVHSHTPDIVSFLVIGLFAVEMIIAHFVQVPATNHDMASQIAGVLNISMGTVLGFWLGGSLSSRNKDVLSYAARGARS